MKKNTIIGIAIFCLLALSGFLVYEKHNDSKFYYPINEITGRYGQITYSSANYIADFEDIRKVSGFADNVFVCEVIKDLGKADEIGGSTFPNTNFEVKVLYNIKGELKGNIIVRQSGGYNDDGTIEILDNNELLKEGDIYLLATKGNIFSILSHPNGSHFLFDDNQKSLKEAKGNIETNKIVNDFREAYKNEIYYEGDYKISSELNAYKNLNQEQKNNLDNIDSGFVIE